MTVDKREKNKTHARSNKGGKTPTSHDDEGAVLRKVNSSRKTKSARERTRDKRDGPKLSAVNNNPSDEGGAVLRKVNKNGKKASRKDADKAE